MKVHLGIESSGYSVSSDGYYLTDSNGQFLITQTSLSNWKVNLNGTAYKLTVGSEKEEE